MFRYLHGSEKKSIKIALTVTEGMDSPFGQLHRQVCERVSNSVIEPLLRAGMSRGIWFPKALV
jgi:hypothetical protein